MVFLLKAGLPGTDLLSNQVRIAGETIDGIKHKKIVLLHCKENKTNVPVILWTRVEKVFVFASEERV
jgi:hypothetical protein